MSQQVGPNPVDVRIVEQKDVAADEDYRVEIGYRPSVVMILSLGDGGTGSSILVSYDGFKNDAGTAQGGVLLPWSNAHTDSSLLAAALGITFEDTGYVIGKAPGIKLNKGHLVLMAFGTQAPVADLETDTVETLAKGGGFGTGKMFEYDATPPKVDWIGPTT